MWKSGMVGLDPGNNASPLGGCLSWPLLPIQRWEGWDTPWKNLINMGPILSMGMVYLPT